MFEDVQIRNLTFVINLNKSTAKSYLEFMNDSKMIKIIFKNKDISSIKFDNQYLIIFVDDLKNQPKGINEICNSLIKNKLHFIVIDELFPTENKYLLLREDCPNKATWVKKIKMDKINSSISLRVN
jgi:predicted AAA+ superfamily ATPase